MQTEVLGTKLYVSVYVVKATIAREQMERALQLIVALIGMDTAGLKAAVWNYPLPEGQGGEGETICQPLVESFIVSDSWHALAKTYVVLGSCRKYNPRVVEMYLNRMVGPAEFQGWIKAE